jgi:hypothetical protein
MDLEDALIRYQYDDAPPLSFHFLPDRLVNKQYCSDLARIILQECNGKWEKLSATQNLYSSIPDKPGLYMFVWKICFPFEFDSATTFVRLILYIGKAGEADGKGTIRSRYKTEYSRIVSSDAEKLWTSVDMSTRSGRLQKFLNLYELEYWFLVMDNCTEMSKIGILEDKLIKLFNPPANRKGTRGKFGATEDAF